MGYPRSGNKYSALWEGSGNLNVGLSTGRVDAKGMFDGSTFAMNF